MVCSNQNTVCGYGIPSIMVGNALGNALAAAGASCLTTTTTAAAAAFPLYSALLGGGAGTVAPAIQYQACKKTTVTKDNTTLSVTDLHTKKTATGHTCLPQPLCAAAAVEPTPDVNLHLEVQPSIVVEAPAATRAVAQPDPQVTFNVEMQPEVVTRSVTPAPAAPATTCTAVSGTRAMPPPQQVFVKAVPQSACHC